MSTFWSLFIALATLGTLLGLTWLLIATRKGQRPGDSEQTTGHSFDGIEEYDNPLPRWWFLLFLGTLAFAFGYLLLYPGLGNFKGLLPGYDGGWTQVGQWQREMATADARYNCIGKLAKAIAQLTLDLLANDRLKVAHNRREGVRADGRAHQIVRRVEMRDPLAHRLVDGILQRL